MYTLEFELQGLPRSQTNNYANWRTRHKDKKYWEDLIWINTIGKRPADPVLRAHITITRCSTTEPDFDNLVASGKPLLDGLVKCRIILDDKPSVIGHPTYLWEKAKRGHGKVKIRVEEVDESVEIGPRVSAQGEN